MGHVMMALGCLTYGALWYEYWIPFFFFFLLVYLSAVLYSIFIKKH